MPNIARILDDRVTAAMRAAYPDVTDAPAIVMASSDPRFGDYQANGAMGLAKRLKAKPRYVAQAIIAKLDVADVSDPPEIAGPGFLNFRLKAEWLAREAGLANKVESGAEDRLGVPRAEKAETVVVDYSAPNLAKEMHVGHLRSTIIGDALARMLDFAGHKVVRQNHVGDWGTQFGMLMAFFDLQQRRKEGELSGKIVIVTGIKDQEAFYRAAKKLFDSNPDFATTARQYVVRLQGGDPAVSSIWGQIHTSACEHCDAIYRKLGVLLRDGDIRGESRYNNLLPAVVQHLKTRGMLQPSEDAQCVFLKDAEGRPLFVNKEGEPFPLIIQKSDEGYLYATTDLAALAFRAGIVREFSRLPDGSDSPHAHRIIYVVDARQALHFKMVFEAARQAGFAKPETVLEHIAFGTMMGQDGKPFKTREGGTVKLMDLLDEAEKRALALVSAKNAADVAAGKAEPLSEEQMKDIAHKVGIGAVKYADLSQNRTSDYVFSWEKMLALDGNTAPYMQYAYTRVRSIFRKGEHDAETLRGDAGPISLGEPQERALAKKVLQLAETLDRALEDYRPNIVAAYLYDLAQAFTAFYDACPVLSSPEPVRTDRLKLCDLTARVMARGLGLLGIETAERM